jgi:hypothetical protein
LTDIAQKEFPLRDVVIAASWATPATSVTCVVKEKLG